MRPSLTFLLAATLFAVPFTAWADTYPDFDDDAKPILKMQPGLLHYVESRFDVKDTGKAKYPGDDDRAPSPPYIFEARPIGSSGPYNLRLLIQPGPVNHILNVVDLNRVHLSAPPSVPAPQQQAVANQPAPQAPEQPVPSIGSTAPAASSSATAPTADTPSGPIMDNTGKTAPLPPAPSSQPSLQPPPDPAPGAN